MNDTPLEEITQFSKDIFEQILTEDIDDPLLPVFYLFKDSATHMNDAQAVIQVPPHGPDDKHQVYLLACAAAGLLESDYVVMVADVWYVESDTPTVDSPVRERIDRLEALQVLKVHKDGSGRYDFYPYMRLDDQFEWREDEFTSSDVDLSEGSNKVGAVPHLVMKALEQQTRPFEPQSSQHLGAMRSLFALLDRTQYHILVNDETRELLDA